jgi:hypothetical protein
MSLSSPCLTGRPYLAPFYPVNHLLGLRELVWPVECVVFTGPTWYEKEKVQFFPLNLGVRPFFLPEL